MEKTHLLAQLKTGLKTVGARQTLRALQRRVARAVFVARDADPAVVQPIVELARSQAVQLIYVESMQALGRACGIEVGASTAALVEEQPTAKRQAKGG
ncbi:MAG TPA: ribosomal L7Ae/L30e/S12e/Gadd45 family protein [Limnochordales bacterium]